MRILDRYASAVRSSNLRSEPDTTYSDSDVNAAFGFAGHRLKFNEKGDRRNSSPLAVALTRLFMGDNHAAQQIVGILAEQVRDKAIASDVDLKPTQAQDMARAVLAWHRDGVCKACNGHGFDLIPGAPAFSGNTCQACDGTRKTPFAQAFPHERRNLAWWLLAEVEREQSRAGPAAMALLAPRLTL